MKKWWPIGLVVIGIALFGLYQYQKYRVAPTLEVFAFDYRDTSGKKVNLNIYKGKKIIYSFWGTWCGECVMEMKKLNAVKEREFSDVEVIMVSDEPIELIKGFAERKKYPFTFLQFERAFPEIGVNAIPVNYLINAKGEVVYSGEGSLDWTDNSVISMAKESLK